MFFNETTKEMKKAKSHKTIGKANMNKEEKCTNKKKYKRQNPFDANASVQW